jgi:hypothetical protein
MSSVSSSAPAAKRAKPAPAARPSWILRPVKIDEKGPIEGAQLAPRGPVHGDFKKLKEMIDLIFTGTDEPFFDTFNEVYFAENYNTPMAGKRLMYAKIALVTIKDFLYEYVWNKKGGVLKTRIWYVPESMYVAIRSSFLEEWMPVLEEDKEYGTLTHGNFAAFMLALVYVATSENPSKALGLKELP